MPFKGHAAAVLRFFENHATRTVYLAEIAAGAGLTETQTLRSIHTLRAKPEIKPHIQTILAGQAWRWNADPDSTRVIQAGPLSDEGNVQSKAKAVRRESRRAQNAPPVTFTQIGITQAGVVIARDAQNNLYRVEPM